MDYLVGLDLSLQSSGCAILHLPTKTWYLSSFAGNKSQIGSFRVKEDVYVTIFPCVPNAKTESVLRYHHVQMHLTQEICKRIPHDKRTAHTKIMLEHYCVTANQRTTAIRLHESGGIVKSALYTNGFQEVATIDNKKWKAGSVGNGNAAKIDTVRYVRECGPQLDLLSLFGFDEQALSFCKRSKSLKVPCPVQDLADAAAICMYLFNVLHDTLPKRTKKPKIVIEHSPQVKAELALRIAQKKHAQKHSQWANTETPKRTKRQKVCARQT